MEVFYVLEPNILYKKDRGFWLIECKSKVASDISDVGETTSSSLIRAWKTGATKDTRKKKVDTLLDTSTWMDFVVEARSKRGIVAKHSAAIVATDASDHQHPTIIDVKTHFFCHEHMECAAMTCSCRTCLHITKEKNSIHQVVAMLLMRKRCTTFVPLGHSLSDRMLLIPDSKQRMI